MIEHVQYFKTSDGAVFNTLQDAQRYEDGMALYKLIETRITSKWVDDWGAYVIEDEHVQTFIESNWEDLKRVMEKNNGS